MNIASVAIAISPGILTTGDLTLSGTQYPVNYIVNLNGPNPGSGYDQILVNGSVSIANTSLTVTIGAPFLPTIGEVFTIVATEGEWYQVSREGEVAGWMHRNLGTRRESTNLPLKIGEIVEARLAYFDQFKNEDSFFRRQGWFPSFFLRNAAGDLRVTEPEEGGREVAIDLSYALKDIEYRMIIRDAGSFILPGANRTFLADLMLSVFDAAPEVERVRLNLWFAVLDSNGTMTWRAMGGLVLASEAAARIPREGGYGDALWGALEENTTPPSLWERGKPD